METYKNHCSFRIPLVEAPEMNVFASIKPTGGMGCYAEQISGRRFPVCYHPNKATHECPIARVALGLLPNAPRHLLKADSP